MIEKLKKHINQCELNNCNICNMIVNYCKKDEILCNKIFIDKSNNFQNKYHTDENFRKKHNAYMLERIICPCGFKTSRNNLTKHKRSRNHLNRINNKNY